MSTHPHLPLPRTEIEVQASLKPLLHEARVGGHVTQMAVPATGQGVVACVCMCQLGVAHLWGRKFRFLSSASDSAHSRA